MDVTLDVRGASLGSFALEPRALAATRATSSHVGSPFEYHGFFYDNFVLGMGAWVGVGHTLATLSSLRYVFHALLTPLLLLTGQYIAHANKISWALSMTSHYIIGFIVVMLIVVGIQEHLLGYQAYPGCQPNGLMRYTQGQVFHPELWCEGVSYPASSQQESVDAVPPLAAIGTILVLLVMGLQVAVINGNGWLLLGSLIMCLAAAAAAGRSSAIWLGNGGEVVLVTFMTITMRQAHVLPPRLD